MPPKDTQVTMHVSRQTRALEEASGPTLIAPMPRGENLEPDNIQPAERHQEPRSRRAALAPQDRCCWRLGSWMREGSTIAVSGFVGLGGGIGTVLAVQAGTHGGVEDANAWFLTSAFIGGFGLPLLSHVVGNCLVGMTEAVHERLNRLNQAPAPSTAELV